MHILDRHAATPTRAMQNGAQQQTGTIKWFDRKKGIGFASPAEGGDDIFVHQANLWTDSEGKPPFLDEGVAICYDVSQREGRPIAVNVKLPPGAVSRQPAGGRAAQVSQRDAASALGTLTVSESQPKKRGVVAKAEAPAAAPGGDEVEKNRLKEQAERKQKNRAEHKEKGIDRPTLEKKNKELEANLAGLKAANPDVTRLHEQLQQKTAALASAEELQQAGAVRTAAGLKLLKVVAEAELGHRVDVAKFKLPSGSKVVVEKPKGQDHQLCFKFTEPPISATVNVFTNGKLVVLSAPSEVAASQAVHLTAGLLGSTASAEQLVSSFRVLTRQAQYASPQRIMLAKLLSTLKRRSWWQSAVHPVQGRRPICRPGPSEGAGRPDAAQSAAGASWKLAVASGARLRPPLQTSFPHFQPSGARATRAAWRQSSTRGSSSGWCPG